MPTSVVAGGIAAAAAAEGGGWAAFWWAFASSLAVRAVAQALQKKSKQQTSTENRLTTIRQAAAPRQVVLGQARVGGTITFAHIQNAGGGYFLHLVITLAGHVCQEIGDVWLDDEIITAGMLDSTGLVLSGRYRNIEFRPRQVGDVVPGSPFQVVLDDAGPLGTDGLTGLDSVVLVLGEDSTMQLTDVSPAAPANLSQYSISGTGPVTVTFHSSAQGVHYVINYRQNLSGGAVRIQKSLGTEAGQPFADLVAGADGRWTDAHRQTGCTKIYLRLAGDIRFFANGIPNVTAVLKGVKAFDPRTGLTAWTQNAALLTSHYVSDAAFYGYGAVFANEIHTNDLIAAANTCDEAVSLAAGGTEPRYRVNGAFLTSEKPIDVLSRLLAAMAGKAIEVGDRWRVYAGAYTAPTVTLAEKDLRGPLHTETLPDLRDSCNGVKGVYTSAANAWQPTDFPALASAVFLAEDGGQRVWRDMDLSAFVTSATQAQRLAKIELLRTRNALTQNAPWKLTAYSTVPGKTVNVQNTKYGWTPKVFEIFSSKFVVETDKDGAPRIGVDQVLRETSAAIYDWSTSDEQAASAAPNTSLPDPFVVAVPGAPAVTEVLYRTSGSAGVKSRATVSWMNVSDPFFDSYVLEWKNVTEPAYHVVPVPRGDTAIDVDDQDAGIYLFRLKTRNIAGVESLYSPITTKELIGLSAPPSDPTGFAVQAYAGQAKFTWDKPTDPFDLDVLIGGRAFVRWSPLSAGAAWDHGSLVNPEGYPGDTTIGFGPLMTGTYMLKFRDSVGNYSVNEATFVVTEALLTGLATLATVTESPTFPGTKVNVTVVDAGLQLVGALNWDSIPGNIDTWGLVDSAGGIVTSGSYAFSQKLDLGSVKNVRLFSTIDSLGFDTADNWDDRTNNMDDWGLVDGAVIEDAEAELFVRTTNDDPNGSPSWGPFHPLGLVGDYNARGFDFRLDYTSGNVTHNRRVTTLSVAAKQ